MFNIVEEGLRGQTLAATLNKEAKEKKIVEHKKNINLKQYFVVIKRVADMVANDNCDLIETGTDENGRACSDIFALEESVKNWVYDNFPLYKKKSLIILHPAYQYEPADMCLSDCFFVDKHNDILEDCINDIRQEVEQLGNDLFWDSY